MNRAVKNIFPLLALLIVVCLSLPALAQMPGDMNLHVSTEVAVPGHLLAPGDYIFRHVQNLNLNTFEIVSGDGSHFVGFVNVLPAFRANGETTQVNLSASNETGVPMIQSWFTGGDADGYQFVYSPSDLRKLDQLAKEQTHAGSVAGQP
jgi:hypothetical protein